MKLPCLIFLLIQTFLTVSSQRIQGRYGTSHNQRCNSPTGCHSNGNGSPESDDKHESVDDYRSIRRTDENKDFKRDSASQPGRVRFDYEANLKDRIDKTYYGGERIDVSNPSLSWKDELPINGGAYNKPSRGSDRPRQVTSMNNAKADTDTPRSIDDPKPDRYAHRYPNEKTHIQPEQYRPKDDEHQSQSDTDIPRSIDDPKPDRYAHRYPNEKTHTQPEQYRPKDDEYQSQPDRYNPTSVHEEYGSKPSYSIPRPIGNKPGVGRDDVNPNRSSLPSHGIANDRPDVKYDYHKPRPDPNYHNKDLGGYYVPKDEEYPFKGSGDDILKPNPPPVVESKNCICVPYYQCQDGHIVTDGAGIIDARKKSEPDEELPLEGKFKPPMCGSFQVCCNTPESSTVRPYEHKCGVRNPSGINSRLLSPSNKGEADFGEWPWQAAVLKSEGKVNIFMCGGVLIDKLHVITVAHCVIHLHKFDEYPLKVRLGEWDTQITSEFLAHEDYGVSKIFIQPEYNNTNLRNDIAILRLENEVLFAPHIDTICLPRYDEIFVQQNCVVTGWGKDAYKGGTFSNVMKEVALQVIDNYQCEELLRKTRLGRFFQLHDGFLCAGGEYGLDSCKGDGGGPLVCYRKDKSYALAGIVSWGIDCGQPGVPGVYVKVQKYLDWISKITGTDLEDYWPRQ